MEFSFPIIEFHIATRLTHDPPRACWKERKQVTVPKIWIPGNKILEGISLLEHQNEGYNSLEVEFSMLTVKGRYKNKLQSSTLRITFSQKGVIFKNNQLISALK